MRRNIAAPGLRGALAHGANRDVFAVPGNVTNKNARAPNTLKKQGAKLAATAGRAYWEDLSSQIHLELEDATDGTASNESKPAGAASLFNHNPAAGA
jgi:DNA processing protein